MQEKKSDKELVYLRKIHFCDGSFRFGLFLDDYLIVTFPREQRFRACMAVQNLYFAIFHDVLDPLDVIIFE